MLQALDADVAALTEADDPSAVETLAGRLGMDWVWERGSGRRHLATLSKLPVLASRVHRRRPLTQGVLQARLQTTNGPLTVYNAHLLPEMLLPFEIRRWQAVGQLLRVIRDESPGPHLVVGDLNSVAPGDPTRRPRHPVGLRRLMFLQGHIVFRFALRRLLRSGYTDCFRATQPDAPGYTFMPGTPLTRYDYILADREVARGLLHCRVADEIPGVAEASDHLPVVAEFDLRGCMNDAG